MFQRIVNGVSRRNQLFLDKRFRFFVPFLLFRGSFGAFFGESEFFYDGFWGWGMEGSVECFSGAEDVFFAGEEGWVDGGKGVGVGEVAHAGGVDGGCFDGGGE